MSQNIGTLITSPIRPNDSLDLIASAFQNEIKGGIHSYATIAERDSLILERRQVGMLVGTQDDQNIWKLLPGPWTQTSADWQLFISSGSTSLLTGGTSIISAITSSFISLSGTNGVNIVTGDIEFDDNLGLSWNSGDETIAYDSLGGTLAINSTNGVDFETGAILSAGTDLYSIFLTDAPDTTTASNGLTKTGDNITLGGVLTGDTYLGIDGNLLSLTGGSITMSNSFGLNIGTNIIDGGNGFFGSANYLQMRTKSDYSEPWFFINADGGTSDGKFIQYSLGNDEMGISFMKPNSNYGLITNSQFSLYDNSGLYSISNQFAKKSVIGFIAAEGSAISSVIGSIAIATSAVTMTENYTLYTDKLNLVDTPVNNNLLTQILARDTDGSVKYRDVVSIITGATSASTQNLSQVLTEGNTTSGNDIIISDGDTLSFPSTTQTQLIMAPANIAAPVDGSMWFTTSGGTTVLNYQVSGVTKSVELT
jgi:hypothetical protein